MGKQPKKPVATKCGERMPAVYVTRDEKREVKRRTKAERKSFSAWARQLYLDALKKPAALAEAE